ncbi:15381_t:CDS:2 [Funneliformis mosseae]|uniref:15381_t:CDS:1 n=1 Tax=Funneliformis mosseae TaxID=27381 RepID=A0A9N9FJ97_FUNMO|nr:15381_t:CDS:2 [Funneliformis mosseae]
MSEFNTSSPRVRKRKGSSKSITRSNKRRASTIEVNVKQEPIAASPILSPKELPKSIVTEIPSPQVTLPNDQLRQPTRPNLETQFNHSFPKNFTMIPNEIFAQICAHLPPSDLLSMTLVCRKLNELLCSLHSQETQAIWKTSRTRFLRFLQLNPPPELDEKSYFVLRQLENGCQFCHGHGIGLIRVYWEFRVRCCESCLDKNTMRRDTLYIDLRVPDEVLRTLPRIFRGASHVYWMRDVDRAMIEYNNLRKEEIQFWVEHKENIAHRIMQQAETYEQEENDERLSKLEGRFVAQSPNNLPQQVPIPQRQIFIRQPQLVTNPMNNFYVINSSSNYTTDKPIYTSPQISFTQPHQFCRSKVILPSQYVKSQLLYSHYPHHPQPRQQIFPQHQMIPAHVVAGIPQPILAPQPPPQFPHLLTPQMMSSHYEKFGQF